MVFFSYFKIFLLIFIYFSTINESFQSECDKCVPSSVNNRYYAYLGRLFNKLPTADIISLKNQLLKDNISVECQPPKFGPSDINTSNYLFKLLEYLNLPFCNTNTTLKYKSANSTWKMWMVGFACVTVINTCAALGFVFRPLLKSKYYNVVMAFMIAMAVGSLTGSAILILIPDAFNLAELYKSSSEQHIDYKWKATVVFGGVYMFFLVERFLKWITNRKGLHFLKHLHHNHGSLNIERSQKSIIHITEQSMDCDKVGLNNISETLPNHGSGNGTTKNNDHNSENEIIPPLDTLIKKHKKIASVAWMIIFGDALHNFIDGLSIGASFSFGIFKGISLSLAVLCEELPHELGDFAILLNAGMTIRQALLWNLLSAATCYLGFIVGVILGEMTSSSTWIFAIAGGMFLYISLVDMMPELNALLEKSDKVQVGRLSIFVIQNLGLLFGYSIILVMALYGDRINIE